MKYKNWLEIWLNNYVQTTCKARTSNIYRYRVEHCIVPHLGEYELHNLMLQSKHTCRAGYELTLKSIQYGTASTGYVFDYPSQKKDMADLDKCVGHIKYILHTDKVTIVAPWGDATVYVLVKHDAELDPFSKKVLQFWITRNGGRASIASVQRGLNIGFNRAGRILDRLQELGCVEPLSPNNNASKPLRVQINLQEINILFPQYLGRE